MNFSSNMNLPKTCLTAMTTLGLSICSLTPAFGLAPSEIVKYQSPQQEVLTINLHSGLGTNISFNAVNETVETMFVDNQSYISVNTDGCLVGSQTQTCPPGSAPTLIHLSLIDDIELPGVIRVNKRAGHKSLLTVVTTDARRQKKTYIFTLKLFGKNDSQRHVALIQMVPTLPASDTRISATPNKVKPRARLKATAFVPADVYVPIATVDVPFIPVNLRVTNRQTIDYLATGFRLAIYRGDFKYNNPQYQSINKFMTALNGGAKLDAAASYGLNLNLVANLVSLGTPAQQ
jgi:hypothetical protein